MQYLRCFKNKKRKMTVIKKYCLMFWVMLSLMFIPLWVSAEVLRGQPVRMFSLSEPLAPVVWDATSAETDEGLDFDDENIRIFAGPLSEVQALSESANAFDVQHAKRAKMKVLTCHVTTSTTDTMRTIFPWVETGVKVAHIAYFEIENKSDFVKFKIKLQGPEFSAPLVLETLTFGPQEPLHQWGIGFWRTYSVPGLYKIKMTAFPETNKGTGKSSIECNFRVSEPAGH